MPLVPSSMSGDYFTKKKESFYVNGATFKSIIMYKSSQESIDYSQTNMKRQNVSEYTKKNSAKMIEKVVNSKSTIV